MCEMQGPLTPPACACTHTYTYAHSQAKDTTAALTRQSLPAPGQPRHQHPMSNNGSSSVPAPTTKEGKLWPTHHIQRQGWGRRCVSKTCSVGMPSVRRPGSMALQRPPDLCLTTLPMGWSERQMASQGAGGRWVGTGERGPGGWVDWLSSTMSHCVTLGKSLPLLGLLKTP